MISYNSLGMAPKEKPPLKTKSCPTGVVHVLGGESHTPGLSALLVATQETPEAPGPHVARFLPALGSYGFFPSMFHNRVFSPNCHNEMKSVTLLCLSLLFQQGHGMSLYTEKHPHTP